MAEALRILFMGSDLAVHLPRWLNHFAARGWTVCYVGTATDGLETVPGIMLRRLPPGGPWRRLIALRRYIRELRPDIINVHDMHKYTVATLLAGNIPVVLAGWGDDILIDPQRSRRHYWWLRLTVPRAARVHSIAPHMTAVLTDYLHVPPEKIITRSWGCDTAIFSPAQEPPRPEHPLRVVTTRGFLPVYNWELAMRAIPLVRREVPDAQFCYFGEGADFDRARGLARELELAACLSLPGRRPPQELAAALLRAHVFLTVSRSDGNNVSLNEAMACGSFPVVSDIPANTQWVTDGDNGLVLTDGEPGTLAAAIVRAWRDPQLRARAAERNRAIVRERADFGRNLTVMEEHYRDLIAARRRPVR